MKKVWGKPKLEILDIRMTMNGLGNAIPDCYDVGDGNGQGVENHDGMSNAACKDPNLGS